MSDEEAPSGSFSDDRSSEIPKPKLRWTWPMTCGERPRTAEDEYEVEEVYEPGSVPRRCYRPPSG